MVIPAYEEGGALANVPLAALLRWRQRWMAEHGLSDSMGSPNFTLPTLPGAPSAAPASAPPPGPRVPPAPPMPAFDRAKDLADFDAQMARASGGAQGGVNLPSGNYSAADLALKQAQASLTGLKLEQPDKFEALKDWQQRRAEAGVRPDMESDAYNPLQGKGLSDFMLNFGLNMLNSSGNGRNFASSLGASAKDAKMTAEARAGKKLALDTETWKQKLADASTMTGLGQTDYGNATAAAQKKFEAARQAAEAQGKLGTEMGQVAHYKSADAARRAELAQSSGKAAVQRKVEEIKAWAQEYARTKARDPKNAKRPMQELYDEGFEIGSRNVFNPRPEGQPLTAGMKTVNETFPDLATKDPQLATALAAAYANPATITPESFAALNARAQALMGKK